MVNFRQEVSDDVARLGRSFGSFIQDVGKGVAETQRLLDVNSAAITKQLAETEIEVPAVVEQVLGDDGRPDAGNAVNVARQKMSLIQFIVPTFYQWRHVQINLNFDVQEIGAIGDFKIRTRQKGLSLFGKRFGGSSLRRTSGTLEASDTDQADGSVDARLEPRPDITPPAPFLFRTGPTINFIPGADIVDAGNTVGANLKVQVFRADGTANDGQNLKVSVNQGRYSAPAGLVTAADGTVDLEVRKPDPAALETQTVSVSVALGVVHARMDVAI